MDYASARASEEILISGPACEKIDSSNISGISGRITTYKTRLSLLFVSKLLTYPV
jgi:hypothetical protein